LSSLLLRGRMCICRAPQTPPCGGRGPVASPARARQVSNTARFSSVGPASDGRLKPDIVAPGERVYSARSDGMPYTYLPAPRSARPPPPVLTGHASSLLPY